MSLRVTFDKPVQSLTGKHGELVYRRSVTGKIYAYYLRKRNKPLSPNERKNHRIFAEVSARAKLIMHNPEERSWWESQYYSLPPEERNKRSLRGYIIAILHPVVKRELFGD